MDQTYHHNAVKGDKTCCFQRARKTKPRSAKWKPQMESATERSLLNCQKSKHRSLPFTIPKVFSTMGSFYSTGLVLHHIILEYPTRGFILRVAIGQDMVRNGVDCFARQCDVLSFDAHHRGFNWKPRFFSPSFLLLASYGSIRPPSSRKTSLVDWRQALCWHSGHSKELYRYFPFHDGQWPKNIIQKVLMAATQCNAAKWAYFE